MGFTVCDEVRYLLVGGLTLLEEHLEDLFGDGAKATVCVEHVLLSIIIHVLTVRVVPIHVIVGLASEGLVEGSFLKDG